MIKTILAAVVAGTFLMAAPAVRAEEKAGAPAADKAEKSKKADKKADKKDDKGAKKDDKAGGW